MPSLMIILKQMLALPCCSPCRVLARKQKPNSSRQYSSSPEIEKAGQIGGYMGELRSVLLQTTPSASGLTRAPRVVKSRQSLVIMI